MPSSLTWIDHDPTARDRALRILSLFQQKESRDELGLGAIRDSFADALFPGTSTIQTRLRYMLFVPWVYTELEKKRVLPPTFAAKARQMEMDLTEPLLANSDHAGVFGRVAGRSLKRLPSSVYWNGLGAWGICQISCSQDEYHRHVDEVYRRREVSRRRYEKDDFPEIEAQTWHPRLPKPPNGFPSKIKNLSFDLEVEEASFLLDRLLKSQKESLLAYLAMKCKPVDCEFLWQHPERDGFSIVHKDLINYAEFFSVMMNGAAFLYNLMLAEETSRKELEDEHRKNLNEWKTRLLSCRTINLQMEGLWKLTLGRGHTITRRTKDFIVAWHRRALATKGNVVSDSKSRVLVKVREQQLKGIRSRFTNARARDQWNGYAGVKQLSYRWDNVKTLLLDLYAGLNGGGHAKS